MLDYERKDFAKLLKRGALEGRRWMRSTDSEAVRIYDRNLEGVPVTVDLYGKYAKIVDYAPGALDESTKAQVIDLVNRMAYVELGRIIYQVRRKREGLEQHTLMSDEKVELVVKEHGLEFLVDLTSHIDTGLFLDHAITREYVRSISEGLRVLNLFSYTGSFSVYAAAGKAESVTKIPLPGGRLRCTGLHRQGCGGGCAVRPGGLRSAELLQFAQDGPSLRREEGLSCLDVEAQPHHERPCHLDFFMQFKYFRA